MRDTELYRHLLGLVTPWEVERVDLSVEDGRVDVWVKHPKRTRFACPDCERELSGQANRVRLGCFTHTSTRPSSTDRSTRSTSHGVTSPSRWRYSSVSRIPQSCRRPADQSQTGPTENSEAPHKVGRHRLHCALRDQGVLPVLEGASQLLVAAIGAPILCAPVVELLLGVVDDASVALLEHLAAKDRIASVRSVVAEVAEGRYDIRGGTATEFLGDCDCNLAIGIDLAC